MTESLLQSPSQTVGPFFEFGLIKGKEHILTTDESKGQRISITGQVFDGDGVPITDGLVELWQPDARGIFNHPNDPNHEQADPSFKGFGRSQTVDNGLYRFETVKPGIISANAIAAGAGGSSSAGSAPYVNIRLFARGMLIHAVTRFYFSDEAANETDPVLATVAPERRSTIIAQRGESADITIYHLDIRLQGDNETVFFDA